MWSDLEPVGRVAATGGYRRFAWTREDRDLREWFAGECAKRGLDATTDRCGNQWAWWGDIDASVAAGRPGVVIGSHLDSVPDGGAFDGPLGVVSALACIDALRERGVTPDPPLGIVNFSDEEGARFGVACMGSRLLTGSFDPQRALGLVDGDGTSMAEGLGAASGADASGAPAIAHLGRDEETLARIGVFVELHVEQGRGLADLGRSVAVGTSIWPHGRWRLDLLGQANHAGTTRLADRSDPMLALAEAILTARSAAQEHGCVATIGKTRVEPGGVNAIPSRVQAWLDARGEDPEAVREVVAAVGRAAGVEAEQESFTPSTTFDQELAARLAGVLGGAPMLGTGAGHDAGILANTGIPVAMLFVRNPTGISHSPQEYAEQADCHEGVAALAHVVADLLEAGSPR